MSTEADKVAANKAAIRPGFRSYSPPNAPKLASLSTRWASRWVHEAV
jgi:hypothetical protein